MAHEVSTSACASRWRPTPTAYSVLGPLWTCSGRPGFQNSVTLPEVWNSLSSGMFWSEVPADVLCSGLSSACRMAQCSYRAGSTRASPTQGPEQYLSHPMLPSVIPPQLGLETAHNAFSVLQRYTEGSNVNQNCLRLATRCYEMRYFTSINLLRKFSTRNAILEHVTNNFIWNLIYFSDHRRAQRSTTTPQYSSQTRQMVVTCGEVIIRRIKHAQEYQTTK